MHAVELQPVEVINSDSENEVGENSSDVDKFPDDGRVPPGGSEDCREDEIPSCNAFSFVKDPAEIETVPCNAEGASSVWNYHLHHVYQKCFDNSTIVWETNRPKVDCNEILPKMKFDNMQVRLMNQNEIIDSL